MFVIWHHIQLLLFSSKHHMSLTIKIHNAYETQGQENQVLSTNAGTANTEMCV